MRRSASYTYDDDKPANYRSLIIHNLRNNEREVEGSGNVVFEKDAENFVDGEKK